MPVNIIINLPWPPTVNSYYSKTKRGVYISKKGAAFRDACILACKQQMCYGLKLDERLKFTAILYPPDRRCRDLDNYMKALLDSITKAKVWEDDEQIDELAVHRGKQIPSGKVAVQISHHHGMIFPNTDAVWDIIE